MIYRNHLLLGLAALVPYCMNLNCRRPNCGNVVSAHSNRQWDGKGMGLKASDAAIAFLCDLCHTYVDQGSGGSEQRNETWEHAHRATMRWLIESGHLVVSLTPQPPPAPPAKPKRTMAKSRQPIPSRGFEKSDKPHVWPKRSFPKRAKP